MSLENVIIKYQGFKMSEWTTRYLQALFAEIALESPRASKINVTITKKDSLIKAMIHIHSSEGAFFSSAVDQNIKAVSDKILFQMRKRLAKWKSKHHERKSLRNIEQKINKHINKENTYEIFNNSLLTA